MWLPRKYIDIYIKGLADIVCANEQRYTKRKNEHHHNFEAYMGVHIAEIEALEEEFGKTVHPAKLFVLEKKKNCDVRSRATRYVSRRSGSFISGKRYVDIMPRGVSKGVL